MIEELTHLPPNVVGFKASGEVKKEDYDKIVFPRIHDQMKPGTKRSALTRKWRSKRLSGGV